MDLAAMFRPAHLLAMVAVPVLAGGAVTLGLLLSSGPTDEGGQSAPGCSAVPEEAIREVLGAAELDVRERAPIHRESSPDEPETMGEHVSCRWITDGEAGPGRLLQVEFESYWDGDERSGAEIAEGRLHPDQDSFAEDAVPELGENAAVRAPASGIGREVVFQHDHLVITVWYGETTMDATEESTAEVATGVASAISERL